MDKHEKIKKINRFIREEIQKVIENQPSPTIKPKPGIVEPSTKPQTKPKRRTLTPPTERPDTKPKASIKEDEKELVKKISQRFKKLK